MQYSVLYVQQFVVEVNDVTFAVPDSHCPVLSNQCPASHSFLHQLIR